MKKLIAFVICASFITGCTINSTDSSTLATTNEYQQKTDKKIENLEKQLKLAEENIAEFKKIIGNAPYLPQFPKEKMPDNINEYQLNVVHLGGAGSKFYQLSAGYPEPVTGGEMEHFGYQYGAQNLGSVVFNSASSVLYLMCKEGYKAVPDSAKSWNESEIIDMDDYYGIGISENIFVHSLTINCIKK